MDTLESSLLLIRMQKAMGFDVQVAHKPATFYLILVHKAKKSKSMIHFGPMCGIIVEIFSPYKYRSVELRARWQCTRMLHVLHPY